MISSDKVNRDLPPYNDILIMIILVTYIIAGKIFKNIRITIAYLKCQNPFSMYAMVIMIIIMIIMSFLGRLGPLWK